MNNFFSHFIASLLLLVGTADQVYAQTSATGTGIHVLAYGVHYGGNIIYSYKVVNSGDTPFNNFTIGSEFDSTDNIGYPQLTRLPLGWKYGEKGETGTEILLDIASTNQPTTWSSWVYGQQETDNYYLRWQASPDSGKPNAIFPGTTLDGFSVTVPLVDSKLSLPIVTGKPLFTGPDEMYIKGGFKVGLASGKDVWGTLEPLDTTPPSLTVSLSPNTLWPPNDKLVPITATITVKDDYDPMPEIKLESIVANEILNINDAKDVQPGTDDRQFSLAAKRAGNNLAGRIYTVTYSATDGSGNKATASATVTVPHDQRK